MSGAAHPFRPAVEPAGKAPRATYRLQFNAAFGFAQAAAILPCLRRIGITHCYASPIFQARPGSTHGYDVCNFDQINPQLGTRHDFELFLAALKENRLGLILDMVPNHMSADPANPWWRDVLQWGPQSRFANYFDIDWESSGSPDSAQKCHDSTPQVVMPILEDHFEKVLEAGKLQLRFCNGSFLVGYHERQFPLAASSCGQVLRVIIEWLDDPAGDLKSRVAEIMTRAEQISDSLDHEALLGLQHELRELEAKSKRFRAATQAALEQFNGRVGQPASFDRLRQLLRVQHYRLAFWRGSEELNYRRFFDVSELVALKMELPEVFRDSHRLILRLLAEDKISGLRIDHPDGLWDPKAYFDRLQESYARVRSLPPSSTVADKPPLYVVVEKILADDEPIPGDWAIHGTTGYEFLNVANGLFVDSSNEPHFDRIYREFSGKAKSFAATIYAARKRVVEKSFISEVNALTRRLNAIVSRSPSAQAFSHTRLRQILTEVLVNFPVYRTYVTEQTRELQPSQKKYIEQSVEAAQQHLPPASHPMLHFLSDLLLLRFPRDLDAADRKDCREFILRFQQLTGPIAAKGVEDTAFYRFNRLLSLNEVGGNPARFGVSTAAFHEFNSARARTFPYSLLTTATHDSKRGEDVRATINVLSEIPGEWESALQRWQRLNAPKKTQHRQKKLPDANDEYAFYQTLIGAWPGMGGMPESAFRERIAAFLLKAVKEAKSNTSWTEPNVTYESATRTFVEGVLDPTNKDFLEDFATFQGKVAFFGHLNSLSQTLLKITSPGVPDFYQGTELWDLNLVDPDNRRPVDFELRQQMLSDLEHLASTPALMSDLTSSGMEPGLTKLFVIQRALQCRLERPDLFAASDYIPLDVRGSKSEHICAFARKAKSAAIIVIVPRLVWRLMNGRIQLPLTQAAWEDTHIMLPFGQNSCTNVLTGEKIHRSGTESVPVARVLASFPLAMLLLERNAASTIW